MQLITVDLTNTMTGVTFSYSVQVNNYTQFYARLNTIMTQLAIIEDVNPSNIVSRITSNKLAA